MSLIAAAYGVWIAWRGIQAGYPASTSLLSAAPWIVIGAVWWILVPYLHRRAASKISVTDPAARGAQRRVVDEAGFHSSGSGVALDLPWSAILRVDETDEFFLFFYNKNLAYYLGKARLSDDAIARVRELSRRVAAV